MFTARNMVFAGVASYDADAATYFAAIATAGSSITTANKAAVNAFIVGCKSDGIWTAIKACCLLAGPDNLTGALVPLVGSAPTNSNFVSGDYSRTAGLVGDGSTKHLSSNRNNDADPQNSKHLAVWINSTSSGSKCPIGSGAALAGNSQILQTTSSFFRVNFDAPTGAAFANVLGSGFCGCHAHCLPRQITGTSTEPAQFLTLQTSPQILSLMFFAEVAGRFIQTNACRITQSGNQLISHSLNPDFRPTSRH